MGKNAQRIEARRATRRQADAPSTLRGAATGPIDAFVHDVSRTGARVECATELALGDIVTIGLSGVGAVRATIVWKRDADYGLDFVTPLSSEDAARAFGEGIVVSLAPIDHASPAPADEVEDGVYAEAPGWLSLLLFMVVAGTLLAATLLRFWPR